MSHYPHSYAGEGVEANFKGFGKDKGKPF